jgi:hypothetical protein
MLTLTACSFIMSSTHGTPADGGLVNPASKMHDLEQIATFIEFSQIVARSSFTENLGILKPTKIIDLNTIMQIDERLSILESSHSSLLSNISPLISPDTNPKRQQYLFTLRLAHVRILLFRPILMRFCLSPQSAAGIVPNLEYRIL